MRRPTLCAQAAKGYIGRVLLAGWQVGARLP
jgi:hypothetical protein